MTTAERRLVPGEPRDGGYRRLVETPGEPYRSHPDSEGTPVVAGRPILVFAQLSDTHVMDHQSPARVELLDRFADPDLLPAGETRTVGTYRPQELFTHHVVEAMVRTVNECPQGPVTGAPVDFAIVTGDLTDNAQYNEMQAMLDLFEGRSVIPDSGDPALYEGVADSGDPRYWHPEGGCPDVPRDVHGFPSRPGVLAASRKPFQASGFRLPWYSVYGNHDNQLQGTLPASEDLESVAVGTAKLITPPEGVKAEDVLERLEAGDRHALAELIGGRYRRVTADPERRVVPRAEHLAAHLASGGSPSGHGYGVDNLAAGICYYAFDVGDRVRVIVLDSVNPHGGWQGSLDEAQFSWLAHQLTISGGRRVVLFSHHPVETFVNGRAPGGQRRVLAAELTDLLLRHSCVVLWVNGHTHTHRVTPVRRPEGAIGFWQVTTASLIDWPQQSRIVELIENEDGAVAVVCTVIDSAAPTVPDIHGEDPLTLAALSRELSANCWQTRGAIVAGEAGAGQVIDRNVVLTLPPAPRRTTSLPAPEPALEVVEEITALVDAMRDLPYGGEPVSQYAHALQAATLAVGIGLPDEAVAAALLHDIGYAPTVRSAAPRRSHERAAAAYLQPRLGHCVAQLVGHHVAAKRYLVAVDHRYFGQLSAASSASLTRQGGPAARQEIDEWRQKDWWQLALLVRQCDDRAKTPDRRTLPLPWFQPLLVRLAVRAL